MLGCGSRETFLMMSFKLLEQAAGRWRRLNKPDLCAEVADGVIFTDGIKKEQGID
jgi:hypothetical protein